LRGGRFAKTKARLVGCRDDNIGLQVEILPSVRHPLRLLLVLVCALLVMPLAAARDAHAAKAGAAPESTGYPAYDRRDDVRAFIGEMAAEYGFDRARLARVFRAARYQPAIVAAMDRPLLEPPKWYTYSRPFLSAERVAAGVAYWNANAGALAAAEERYGVPAEIVVGIIGVETFYGRVAGNYRVLDALTTLAFDYPRRAAFFRGELKQFLLLARELGMPPQDAKGSFAGAMGVPQFMPGSYRTYAVDADGSGHPDLWRSAADIAGSVANYLARHDWQKGRPVLLPAAIADDAREAILRKLDGGLSERRSVDAWAVDGVTVADPTIGPIEEPVGLLLLEESVDGVESSSYRIAFNNFYVLTRYNRSRLYATAVYELAKAVRTARGVPPR
jgi:membrane-bound lytic murein transglycosylase B